MIIPQAPLSDFPPTIKGRHSEDIRQHVNIHEYSFRIFLIKVPLMMSSYNELSKLFTRHFGNNSRMPLRLKMTTILKKNSFHFLELYLIIPAEVVCKNKKTG